MPLSLVLAGVIFTFILVWAAILGWVKYKSQRLVRHFTRRVHEAGDDIILGPQSCLYRGADRRFGNIKGNGILCLTRKRLIFEKLTGQQIEIDRSQITRAVVSNRFRGEIVFATGGKHLVVETGDGNRIGFLLKDAPTWAATLNPE